MSLAVTIEAMVTAGCTPEQMLTVVKAHEADEARRLSEKLAHKRELDAERQRRCRMSRLSRSVTAVTRDTPPPSPPSPSPSEPSPSPPPISPSPHIPARQKTVLKRTQLPEEAQPSERDRELGQRAGMLDETVDLEWQRFRAHHLARGSLMANWGQAWVTWLTNWKGYGSKQAPPKALNGSAGRGRGVYKPGIGMVYPDGSVYSMLHHRKEDLGHGDNAEG